MNRHRWFTLTSPPILPPPLSQWKRRGGKRAIRPARGERRGLPLLFLTAAVIFSLLLTACAVHPSTTTAQPSPSPTVGIIASPTHTPTPSTTPVVQARTATPSGQRPTRTPTPPRAEDLFQVNFATPDTTPSAKPRPPLFPIPWAPSPYDHFYFAQPVPPDEKYQPLNRYPYGGQSGNDIHTGVDIPAAPAATVLATGPGRVIWAGYGLYYGYERPDDPYGLAIAIRHDFGYRGQPLYTVYAHLSEAFVTRGQWVDTFTPIGKVGNTGHTTGPHLHFEVRVGENDYFSTRNPELWIAPPLGYGMLVGRVMNTGGLLVAGQKVVLTSPDDPNVTWWVPTYGKGTVNADPYYRENVVLSNIPAGLYRLRIPYVGMMYEETVEIRPGMVTYFTFQGRLGIQVSPPATPEAP